MSTNANDSIGQPSANSQFAIKEKWGDLSGIGFTAIPNTLIHAQSELGLTPNQVVVLLNLLMHWWSPEAFPFPRSQTIAKRSGLRLRTVQRTLASLEIMGLIKKVRVDGSDQYDMQGMRNRIAELAPKYTWRELSNSKDR